MTKYAIEIVIDDKPTTFEAELERKSTVLQCFLDAITFIRRQFSNGVTTNGATVLGSVMASLASAVPSYVIIGYGLSIPSTPGIVYDLTRDKIYLRRDGKSIPVSADQFVSVLSGLKKQEADVSRETGPASSRRGAAQ